MPPQQPRRHQDRDPPEDQELPEEDIRDVANDDGFDELDDVEPPDRSMDE